MKDLDRDDMILLDVVKHNARLDLFGLDDRARLIESQVEGFTRVIEVDAHHGLRRPSNGRSDCKHITNARAATPGRAGRGFAASAAPSWRGGGRGSGRRA